ncbi:MAG: amidohydrolase family protein [Oscillospiraceae bacterium]|nr:amidohydrolase family protein [Oscillospiraceae bacterium]
MADFIPVTDAHCHIFPDKIAEKSKDSVRDFYDLPMYTSGTVSHLKSERNQLIQIHGQNYKIIRQLICSPAVVPKQTQSINQFISDTVQEDSAFVGFGTIHPDNPDYEEILSGFKAKNLIGLKVHSDFQQFNIDEKNFYPVYQTAKNLNLPVLFHMGDKKLDYSHPRRLAHLLEDMPGLTAIAAHMGGYSHWNEALEVLKPSENLFFDISSTLQFIDGELLMKFIRKFGESQFFFGSDFPMWSPKKELETLIDFKYSENLLSKLLHQNYSDFLKKYQNG